MLIAYMSHLELCLEILDEQVFFQRRLLLPLTEILLFLSLTLDTFSFQDSFESKLQIKFGKMLKASSSTTLVGYLKPLKIPSFSILAAFRSSF